VAPEEAPVHGSGGGSRAWRDSDFRAVESRPEIDTSLFSSTRTTRRAGHNFLIPSTRLESRLNSQAEEICVLAILVRADRFRPLHPMVAVLRLCRVDIACAVCRWCSMGGFSPGFCRVTRPCHWTPPTPSGTKFAYPNSVVEMECDNCYWPDEG
jgi:hypothetical protein